jgi:hypothetical protein
MWFLMFSVSLGCISFSFVCSSSSEFASFSAKTSQHLCGLHVLQQGQGAAPVATADGCAVTWEKTWEKKLPSDPSAPSAIIGDHRQSMMSM